MSDEDEYSRALALLGAGEADPVRRARLVGIVQDYVEHLERVANTRGEKLRGIVQQAVTPAQREREVLGMFTEDLRVLTLNVPVYDASWFADLVDRPQIEITLRQQQEDGQPLSDWRTQLTHFLVVETLEAGDLVLQLSDGNAFGADPLGGVRAQFFVDSLRIARVEPTEDDGVTARRITEAIARGQVRAHIRRKPDGIEVHFEDAVP